MASFNKVILIGRLTRDPDLRTTPNGTAICELGLAVNRRWRDQAGRDQEEVCFVDVAVWGRSAENCAQYLQKGAPVLVEGRLKFDQWEDRNGGGKRSKLSVVAETVQFLAGRSDGQQQPGGDQQQPGGDQPPTRQPQGGYRQPGPDGRNDGGFGAPPPPPASTGYPPEDYDDDSDIPF